MRFRALLKFTKKVETTGVKALFSDTYRIYMETVTTVNDDLRLIQRSEGLTFGTDALLLAGYIDSKYKHALELGAGSGIISLLTLSRDKSERVTALEIQNEYAELCERNAELNGFLGRLTAVCEDVRGYRYSSDELYDAVFTNPPYMRTDSGRRCDADEKNIARHEVNGDIRDFCLCAMRNLKFGGDFYVVYRPDRLIDLVCAMREARLEAKRITFVHADEGSESSMVLVKARYGGKSGAYLTPPLIIYKDNSHREYTDEMNYIMENGLFPAVYSKR